jgi:hypothetical protein
VDIAQEWTSLSPKSKNYGQTPQPAHFISLSPANSHLAKQQIQEFSEISSSLVNYQADSIQLLLKQALAFGI